MNTRSSERKPPIAILSATPTEIIEGESISFSAEASRDTDGELVSIFHAPIVDTTETYTLYAEAEIETHRGEASISDTKQ